MKNLNFYILHVIALFITCHSAVGQDRMYFFENLREDAGLPYHLVNKIDEDSLGRLWLATYNGVYYYDGYDFRPFQHHSQNTNTISSDLCSTILVDRQQNIWVGTNGDGLCKIKPFSKEVIRYDQSFLGNQFGQKGHEVRHLVQDNCVENIWAATNAGLFEIITHSEDSVTNLQLRDTAELKTHLIQCLFADQNGILWMGTQSGLFGYDIKKRGWLDFQNSIQLLKGSISSITQSASGEIWVGLKDENGLYYQSDEEGIFLAYPVIANFENSDRVHLAFDKNNLLWVVGGKTGVFLHDLDSKETQFFPGKDYDQLPGNFSNYTSNPMVDRTGNVWFCGGGLHKYTHTNKQFIQYTHPLSAYQSTSAIYDDENYRITSLWGRGLVIWKKTSLQFLSLTEQHGLFSNNIYSIKAIPEGKILLAGEGGFQLFDPRKDQLNQAIPINGTIYDTQIHDGKIWLAGSKGLWAWDEVKGVSQMLKTYDFRSFDWDQQGVCWLATLGHGLISWDRSKGKIAFFQNKLSQASSIQNNRVEYLKIDPKGIIWLATGSGLESYDPIKKKWNHYRLDSLSTGSRVNVLALQNDSVIWVSNNSGISKLNTLTQQWTHYNVKDGILNPYFYERCFYKNQSGELFFGGRKGVVYFDPGKINRNEYPPKIYFDEIKVDNIELESLNPNHPQLDLNWRNQFFEINYKAVHLSNPKEISYQYRLLPIQKDWINTTQTQLFYSALPSGRYTLEILAANSDDVWMTGPKSLSLLVRPPFWERLWFKILTGLLLISVLAFYIRRREKNISKRAAIQIKINELERAALRAQMSPHFVFNSMSGIQYFITSGNEESALRLLTKLSRLIRRVLEYADQSSIPLEEELLLLENYVELEQMRFAKTIDYQTYLAPDIYPEQIQLPPMLIQPILENAINHGLRPSTNPYKQLRLSISKLAEHQLNIKIEDNGIGRKAATKNKVSWHHSKGTTIVRSRLKLAGEQIKVNTKFQITDQYQADGTPCGTTVELIVPFQLS
jgi:ligand-binding sensor domain-containing protein/signal transduction histidine kinase